MTQIKNKIMRPWFSNLIPFVLIRVICVNLRLIFLSTFALKKCF